MLQHSSVMTVSFCFQIKGDKQVCLTAWPKAPGSVAELPAPSNIPLCMCVPYTLPEGHGTDLAGLWKGKTSFRSVRALVKQGLEANSVETLAAQYSQWFGRSRGEEVKPGEGTEKIPREERGGGQSECCRYYTTGKRQLYLENTYSVLLVVTEEADASSCPSSLAGKQQITHLFLS